MSIETVREWFRPLGRDGDVREFPVSSATVELAAAALSVEPPESPRPCLLRTGRAVCWW